MPTGSLSCLAIDCVTSLHDWDLQPSTTNSTNYSWNMAIHDLIHNFNFWMTLSNKSKLGITSRKQYYFAWMQMMMWPDSTQNRHLMFDCRNWPSQPASLLPSSFFMTSYLQPRTINPRLLSRVPKFVLAITKTAILPFGIPVHLPSDHRA